MLNGRRTPEGWSQKRVTTDRSIDEHIHNPAINTDEDDAWNRGQVVDEKRFNLRSQSWNPPQVSLTSLWSWHFRFRGLKVDGLMQPVMVWSWGRITALCGRAFVPDDWRGFNECIESDRRSPDLISSWAGFPILAWVCMCMYLRKCICVLCACLRMCWCMCACVCLWWMVGQGEEKEQVPDDKA